MENVLGQTEIHDVCTKFDANKIPIEEQVEDIKHHVNKMENVSKPGSTKKRSKEWRTRAHFFKKRNRLKNVFMIADWAEKLLYKCIAGCLPSNKRTRYWLEEKSTACTAGRNGEDSGTLLLCSRCLFY